MDINFTNCNNDFTFRDLKKKDVFYRPDETDGSTPFFYMVTDNVYYDDYFGTSCYNCVCLNTGSFYRVNPDASVKLCKATINIEG